MTTTETPTRTAAIGDLLRSWRQAAGLSIDEVAQKMSYREPRARKVSRELVRRYELGAVDRDRIDIAYLIVVADVLDHDVRELGQDIAEVADDLFRALMPRRGGPAPRRAIVDNSGATFRPGHSTSGGSKMSVGRTGKFTPPSFSVVSDPTEFPRGRHLN